MTVTAIEKDEAEDPISSFFASIPISPDCLTLSSPLPCSRDAHSLRVTGVEGDRGIYFIGRKSIYAFEDGFELLSRKSTAHQAT